MSNQLTFFVARKFFAVKVADLLYTSIDTTRLLLDTSTVSLALLLIKAAQAVVAKGLRVAHGGAPCGADMALIHMSAKINIVGIMWQASRRRRV